MDPFRGKIDGWVEGSHGHIRADVALRKLESMGYTGSDRTLRRAIAEAKMIYRAGHRRHLRPWLPEPGLWFQWDYADGPLVDARKTWLWCAWLAWSRFRVVLPVRDKTLPTVIACIDATLRRFGGVPTYGLPDYVAGHIITHHGADRTAIKLQRVDVGAQPASEILTPRRLHIPGSRSGPERRQTRAPARSGPSPERVVPQAEVRA